MQNVIKINKFAIKLSEYFFKKIVAQFYPIGKVAFVLVLKYSFILPCKIDTSKTNRLIIAVKYPWGMLKRLVHATLQMFCNLRQTVGCVSADIKKS